LALKPPVGAASTLPLKQKQSSPSFQSFAVVSCCFDFITFISATLLLLLLYRRDLFSYLRVGPPLYLVVSGVNVSTAAPDVNKLCSVAGCRQDSLAVRVSGQISLLFSVLSFLLLLLMPP
jgi:hypothetical protein